MVYVTTVDSISLGLDRGNLSVTFACRWKISKVYAHLLSTGLKIT